MADLFAERGYTTVLLDLFNGDPVPLNRPGGFDLQTWLKQGSDGNNPHTAPYVDAIVEAGIKYIKTLGVTKLGAVGYCFGAKVSFFFFYGTESQTISSFFWLAVFSNTFHSTLFVITSTASTSASSRTLLLSRRRNSLPSAALCPLLPLKRTASSPRRSVTDPRRFSRRPSSRIRLICFLARSTGLRCAGT